MIEMEIHTTVVLTVANCFWLNVVYFMPNCFQKFQIISVRQW